MLFSGEQKTRPFHIIDNKYRPVINKLILVAIFQAKYSCIRGLFNLKFVQCISAWRSGPALNYLRVNPSVDGQLHTKHLHTYTNTYHKVTMKPYVKMQCTSGAQLFWPPSSVIKSPSWYGEQSKKQKKISWRRCVAQISEEERSMEIVC